MGYYFNKMFKFVAKRAFSSQNTLMGALNTQGNHNLRVMATPTWPVPYYQRAFRAEANLNMKDGDLMHVGVHLQAGHAMVAKEALKLKEMGMSLKPLSNIMTSPTTAQNSLTLTNSVKLTLTTSSTALVLPTSRTSASWPSMTSEMSSPERSYFSAALFKLH